MLFYFIRRTFFAHMDHFCPLLSLFLFRRPTSFMLFLFYNFNPYLFPCSYPRWCTRDRLPPPSSHKLSCTTLGSTNFVIINLFHLFYRAALSYLSFSGERHVFFVQKNINRFFLSRVLIFPLVPPSGFFIPLIFFSMTFCRSFDKLYYKRNVALQKLFFVTKLLLFFFSKFIV